MMLMSGAIFISDDLVKAGLIFIGPNTHHCLLADSRNQLTDMTLAFEDDNLLILLDIEVW